MGVMQILLLFNWWNLTNLIPELCILCGALTGRHSPFDCVCPIFVVYFLPLKHCLPFNVLPLTVGTVPFWWHRLTKVIYAVRQFPAEMKRHNLKQRMKLACHIQHSFKVPIFNISVFKLKSKWYWQKILHIWSVD